MNEISRMWNERYSAKEYVYGLQPNKFFKECIDKYNISGEILLPAEGEGRNAVFAEKKGLRVTAFDLSIEGRKKALKYANKENIRLDYKLGDILFELADESFDCIALIYAHYISETNKDYQKKIFNLIKPGGLILLEGFSKNNLMLQSVNPKIGGPKNIDMLFSISSITKIFPDFKVIQMEECETELDEGEFHVGINKVVRFVGKKPNDL